MRCTRVLLPVCAWGGCPRARLCWAPSALGAGLGNLEGPRTRSGSKPIAPLAPSHPAALQAFTLTNRLDRSLQFQVLRSRLTGLPCLSVFPCGGVLRPGAAESVTVQMERDWGAAARQPRQIRLDIQITEELTPFQLNPARPLLLTLDIELQPGHRYPF